MGVRPAKKRETPAPDSLESLGVHDQGQDGPVGRAKDASLPKVGEAPVPLLAGAPALLLGLAHMPQPLLTPDCHARTPAGGPDV